MEAFKTAFDTVIVGILALPWLVLILDLCFPNLLSGKSWNDFSSFPLKEFVPTIIGVAILSMSYLLGSAISRLADNLFDDDDVRISATEHAIRKSVYCNGQFFPVASKVATSLKSLLGEGVSASDWCTSRSRKHIEGLSPTQDIFALEEGKVLLQGQDKTERLRQLHQQIVVLRGAAFNGFLLSALCLWAFCAQKHKDLATGKNTPWLIGLTYLPSGFLVLYACDAFFRHFSHHPGIDDPPMIEILLLILGLAGLFITSKNVNQRRYGTLAIFALSIALLTFSGWWTTEVDYDRQIVYSFSALAGN